MRTTVTLDADVSAAVEQLRRERGIGLSEALNELVRTGLHKRDDRERPPFKQHTFDMGARIDLSNTAEALDLLDGPDHR
jgi:Ribbon-helix-helix protein, copG family